MNESLHPTSYFLLLEEKAASSLYIPVSLRNCHIMYKVQRASGTYGYVATRHAHCKTLKSLLSPTNLAIDGTHGCFLNVAKITDERPRTSPRVRRSQRLFQQLHSCGRTIIIIVTHGFSIYSSGNNESGSKYPGCAVKTEYPRAALELSPPMAGAKGT